MEKHKTITRGIHFAPDVRERSATPRPVEVLVMLFLPLLIVGIVACDNTASNSTQRVPYEGTIEGKPLNLGAAVPDPKEVLETKATGQLPSFLAKLDPKPKERATRVYQGAIDNYDAYTMMPCYCGCAVYTTAHQSLAQCYIKERMANGEVVFTDHSLTCDLCQQGAQMTLDGVAQSKPLKTIRTEIFEKLKYTGIWTDTPPIP